MAQAAFDKKDYATTASKARSSWLVSNWPLSDFAPQGQYLVARCYEQDQQDEKAFKAYQTLLEKYPKISNFQEVFSNGSSRSCNRFLAGQWFKLWGYIPFFPSMDKTAGMYEKLIKNGPYSDVAPQAQMNIGAAREKQTRFLDDKEPYIEAARGGLTRGGPLSRPPEDRGRCDVQGGARLRKTGAHGGVRSKHGGPGDRHIHRFHDALSGRLPWVKEGEAIIASLKSREQAHGNFMIAQFYEKKHHWWGAVIYYNEVLQQDPNSTYAAISRERIPALKKLTQPPAQ